MQQNQNYFDNWDKLNSASDLSFETKSQREKKQKYSYYDEHM